MNWNESASDSSDNNYRPTHVEPLTRINGEYATVCIRRVETPKGVRLEIDVIDCDHQVRLDAVMLECLTWQSIETFEEWLETYRDESVSEIPPVTVPSEDATIKTTQLTTISNEFAHVEVGETTTTDRERLALIAPKRGTRASLDSTALESVTYPPSDVLSKLLGREMEST